MMRWYVGLPGLVSLGLQIGALWMFLLRHLDGALVCGSIWNIFSLVQWGWNRKDGNAIPRTAAESLLMIAVLFHSGGLAVAWAVVAPFAYHFLRPSLTAFLHNKFSRAEVAQEIRRSLDTQPWPNLKEKVYTGLRWFRSYELWEEARQWLEEHKESELLSPIALEWWQTMIAIGQGQYELAPVMERLLPQMEQADKSWLPDEINLTALAYARLGKREDALRVINSRTDLPRRQWSGCLADVYTIFGEWEMALRYYEAADRNADTLYGMPTCLTRLGEQREARGLYRQSIILSIYVRLDYLRDLAECCWRIGDDRTALEAERLIFEKEG